MLLPILTMVLMQGASWTPEGLDGELYPIAHLESSFGKNINHAAHSRGEFWSSIGALGLKPVTAYEEYRRSRVLRNKYPDLLDQEGFTTELKNNSRLYNDVCTIHWRKLRFEFQDLDRSIFAWRWGRTASLQATGDEITNDSYVAAYHTVRNSHAHPDSR